jgi:DNA-binding YbaB/EbfC family protein
MMPKSKRGQDASALGAGLIDKLMQMQNQMKKAQEELAGERLTISVGGDAVQVVIDGQQRVQHITVSAEALAAAQQDRGMLEDMLVAAVNHALEQSQTLAAERLQGLSSGLDLPGLDMPGSD